MENRNESCKNENWEKILILNNSESNYIIENLTQDINGIKIVLNNDINIINVFFDGVIPMLRSSIEGIRMRTWGEIQRKYNNRKFFSNCCLYRVYNSTLINWLMEESCGFYDKNKLFHYCIVTVEEMIDIISFTKPIIDRGNTTEVNVKQMSKSEQ